MSHLTEQKKQADLLEAAFYERLRKAGGQQHYEHLVNEKLKEYIMLIIVELTEVINELNYKPHKPLKKIDWTKVKEETIDAYKYTFCLFNLLGMDDNELNELFAEKTKKVYETYEASNRS